MWFRMAGNEPPHPLQSPKESMKKTCSICKNEKDIKEYYKGQSRCKTCHKEYYKKKYSTDKKYRDYHRKYTMKWYLTPEHKLIRKIKGMISSDKHEKNHPEKVKARSELNNSIRKSLIIKPDQCSKCKKHFPIGKIEGHHIDYTRPLDVIWLCRPCHKMIERKYV